MLIKDNDDPIVGKFMGRESMTRRNTLR